MTKGVVAAGHTDTVAAAEHALEAGGNAFDAAIAGMLATCISEPVLSSPGGGGFLMARPADGAPRLYDFFAHTPRRKRPTAALEFRRIVASFGDEATQAFHIGMGSIATPGMMKGIFRVHADLCRLPLAVLAEPALRLAREGVVVNPFMHYIADVVGPIIDATAEARRLHASPADPTRRAAIGERVAQPDLEVTLEAFVREGERLLYGGEIGRQLVEDCRSGGGHLEMDDLEGYEVVLRDPLEVPYHGARVFTNPAPALGGPLIAFSLALLGRRRLGAFGGEQHLRQLARAMRLTGAARRAEGVDEGMDEARQAHLLSGQTLDQYLAELEGRAISRGGTTQLSAADAEGNLVSVTVTNGEGAGYVVPGTGIMVNNCLGEEDLNPGGFHRWRENARISSMTAPTLIAGPDGVMTATGSGGSNRIRSAILQVLINLVDFAMPVEEAVASARLHYEGDLLSWEPDLSDEVMAGLRDEFPLQQRWSKPNLFFGGAHTVTARGDDLHGAADARRGGACRRVG